jgi:TetR/AcrR family transcriptional regulator, mexCD-oprJ operon repressor
MAAAPPEQKRRADAERSIAAILSAGRRCFARNPAASMTEIAREAGVGRVTIYGHFPSREMLLETVLRQAMEAAVQALQDADLDHGSAADALSRLARNAWQVLDGHLGLRTAALHGLGETALREHHEPVLNQVDQLIARGQADGDFRTDLPRTWLVATYYGLIHAAAAEVEAGRLDSSDAAHAIDVTLHAALAA